MKRYIETNRNRFFEKLFSLLRIPSISAKTILPSEAHAKISMRPALEGNGKYFAVLQVLVNSEIVHSFSKKHSITTKNHTQKDKMYPGSTASKRAD